MHHSQFYCSKILLLAISLLYLYMLEFENCVCTGAALVIPSNTNETQTGETTLEDNVETNGKEEEGGAWKLDWQALSIIQKFLVVVLCEVGVFIVVWILSCCFCPIFLGDLLRGHCRYYPDDPPHYVIPPDTPSPGRPARQDLIEYLTLEIEMHENVLAVREQ